MYNRKTGLKNFFCDHGKLIVGIFVLAVIVVVCIWTFMDDTKDEKEENPEKSAGINVIDYFYSFENDEIKEEYIPKITKCEEKYTYGGLIFTLEEYFTYAENIFLARVDVRYEDGSVYVEPETENMDDTVINLGSFEINDVIVRTFFYSGTDGAGDIQYDICSEQTADGYKLYYKLIYDPEKSDSRITFVIDKDKYPVIEEDKNDYMYYYDINIEAESVRKKLLYESVAIDIRPFGMQTLLGEEKISMETMDIIYKNGNVIQCVKEIGIGNGGTMATVTKDGGVSYWFLDIRTIFDLDEIEKVVIDGKDYLYDEAVKAFVLDESAMEEEQY